MKVLKEIIEEVQESQIRFYIYVLYKPNFVPFYVGKGKAAKFNDAGYTNAERVEWHEYEASLGKVPKKWRANRLKINTIRKIIRNGDCVLYAIDSWHDDESSAYTREVELISSIGKILNGTGPLTNMTDGGEKGFAEVTPEIKQKISSSLKEYYSDPEAIKANSERITKYFADNPDACERSRQNAIKNNTAENLARWRKEKPEEFVAKQAAHSDEMKQWYQDNPEAAKEMADNRNKVLRTEEHRQKMAEKTRLYNESNPEAHKARREKAVATLKETLAKHNEIKQKCLWIVHNKLVELGVIKPTKKIKITMGMVDIWRRKGLVDKYFPTLPKGRVSTEFWKEFLDGCKMST